MSQLKESFTWNNDCVRCISDLSDNSCVFISNREITPPIDCYISNIYHSENYFKIAILPRLAIRLKAGYSLDEVLNKFDKILKLDVEKSGIYLVDCHLNSSEEVLKLNEIILQMKATEWCEPMMISNVKKYNSLYSLQYYIHNTGQNGGTPGMDINAEPAWAMVSVNESITVAVIDDGVERSHEDLSGKVLDGLTIDYPNEKGDPINDYWSGTYFDPKCHGTACAGIIAAKDNNIGIKGVASGVQILPINVFPQDEDDIINSYTEKVGNAIRWAYYNKGADIISCSLGFPYSQYIGSAFEDAISDGRGGKGTIVVCASGNSNPYSDVSYPANMTNTIAVGAINKNGGIWYYSCRGSSLDLVAPSSDIDYLGDIVTTDRSAPKGINSTGNYLGWFGGTSAACPQVAGVAALMLSANPNLTVSQVRTKLRNTARDLGITGFDTTYGYGLVDAYAAVCSALSGDKIVGPSLVSTNGVYSIENLPTGVTVEWSLSNSYYNQNCLQQNYPTTNQCRITRNGSHDMMNATLTAYIKYNGVTVQTLTKAGIYAYADFKGHYTSGNLSGDINYTHLFYVKPYYNTYITSPNFYGATVTYDNIGTIPNNWGFSSQSGYLQFIMPTNNGGVPVVINVTDGCGNYYQLYAMPQNSKNLNISPGENSITITLSEDGDSERGPILDQSWTVEIRNATTGALMTTLFSTSLSETISTAGWPKGIYAVKATVDKEELTEKFLVK